MFALKLSVFAAVFACVSGAVVEEKKSLKIADNHPLKIMMNTYSSKAAKKLADMKTAPRELSDEFLEPVTYDPVTKKFVMYTWHTDEGCSDERMVYAWGHPIGQCHELVQPGSDSVYFVQMFGESPSKDVLLGMTYFSDAMCTVPTMTSTTVIDNYKKACTWEYAQGEKNFYKKMDFIDNPPKFHDGTLVKIYQTTGECYLGERGMVEFSYRKTGKCSPEPWNFADNENNFDENSGCYDGEWFFNSFTATTDRTCGGTDITVRAFGKVKYDYYCRNEEKKSGTGLSWGYPRVECV